MQEQMIERHTNTTAEPPASTYAPKVTPLNPIDKSKVKQKIQICVIDSGSKPLCKVFSIKDGNLTKDASTFAAEHTFDVVDVEGVQGLNDLIDSLKPTQAIVTGLPHVFGQPDQLLTSGRIITKEKYSELETSGADLTGTISRTQQCFTDGYIVLYDIDGGLTKFDEIQQCVHAVAPELKGAPMLVRGSSSFGIGLEGFPYKPTTINAHAIVIVDKSIGQLSRVKETLKLRCWNLSFDDRIDLGVTGAMLERQFVDSAVFSPERIIYCAPAVLNAGVVQHLPSPVTIDEGSGAVFSLASIPDLTASDRATALELIATAKRKVKPESDRKKAEHLETIVERSVELGCDPVQARKDAVAHMTNDVLYSTYSIHLDDHGWVTVSAILDDPEKYDGATGADPVEPHYNGGRNIGVFYANLDKATGEFKPIYNTRAHGGQNYRLQVAPIESPASDEIYNSLAAQLGVDAGSLKQRGLINQDRVERIFDSAWFNPGTKQIQFLPEHDDLLSLAVPDAVKALPRAFGAIFNKSVMNELIDEFIAGKELIEAKRVRFIADITSTPINIIIERLKFYNQRKRIYYTVDPFIEKGFIGLPSNKVTVVLPMPPVKFTAKGANGAVKAEVIADYLDHFSNFHKLIDAIVAARFAPDRKNASVWIHGDTDFGKNFFTDMLRKVGLSADMTMKELEKMTEGSPVGRTAEEFIHSPVLVFDEVKTVKAELKMASSRMMLSAKFESMSSVEVFFKILLSAEMINSLAGEQGVEGQFANRISYFRLTGSIKSRVVFQRVGNGLYHDIVTEHLAEHYQQRVDEYVALGELAASKVATDSLNAFHNEFNLLNTFHSLDDTVAEVAASIRTLIFSYVDDVRDNNCERDNVKCSKQVHDLLKSQLVFSEANPLQDERIVLKSPTKFIEAYIDSVSSFGGKVSLTYKTSVIASLLGVDGRHRIHSGKVASSGLTQHRGILLEQMDADKPIKITDLEALAILDNLDIEMAKVREKLEIGNAA